MKVPLAAVLAAGVLVAPVFIKINAQSFGAFGARPTAQFAQAVFTDAEVDALTATLDRLVADTPSAASWRDRASDALWQFARRIQSGRVSPAQEARVLGSLDRIGRSRTDAAPLIVGPRRLVTNFSPGKLAPEITGRDLDGRPFRLSEYRKKVVLLTFTADWCAICRAQAPYERFLLDKYAGWPLAILAVETGSSREAAKQAHARSPLSHRSWWDEPRASETDGLIASSWGVTGFPASYVIDGEGVIRFVNVREEALLIAVRQLLEAEADRALKSQRSK